jgi:hypothetical protein
MCRSLRWAPIGLVWIDENLPKMQQNLEEDTMRLCSVQGLARGGPEICAVYRRPRDTTRRYGLLTRRESCSSTAEHAKGAKEVPILKALARGNSEMRFGRFPSGSSSDPMKVGDSL